MAQNGRFALLVTAISSRSEQRKVQLRILSASDAGFRCTWSSCHPLWRSG
jgi:hypothetical protein